MTWAEQKEYIDVLLEQLELQRRQMKWLWSLLTPEAKQLVQNKLKELPF